MALIEPGKSLAHGILAQLTIPTIVLSSVINGPPEIPYNSNIANK